MPWIRKNLVEINVYLETKPKPGMGVLTTGKGNSIKVKKVPIKVYNSVGKVEWYYILLYHIYKIISLKLKGISKELTL